MKEFEINKFTPQCGAEVRGLDLSSPLSPFAVERLKVSLAEHCVLFFRNQVLTPSKLKLLGQAFGELHLHPAWPRLVSGHPEVMEIYADENTKRIAGEDWHSDVSCDPEPPLGSMLYLFEVPPQGGDTLFANMYEAFEALSSPLQKLIEELTALHDGEKTYRGRYEGMVEDGKVYPCSKHPVVRTHPITGRPLLFVNRIFTTCILGLSRAESDSLLELLFRHIEQPKFQCRFQWQSGSLAFWDNRCVQHHAIWDYYPHRRVGHRVTIKGDTPFFRKNHEKHA